ncbi:TrbI/VirB10 family protein [Aminobacter sp. NyZ550]|uniref:Type IV secretion system protein VirB10 n=1 Tax=Aminobacter ciceronei TaxID=150723 RepID=A0ABR6C953_9HYPH|nr:MULTISPECIES: TrbI/VirB10 family protein [Aminobacter]MBA8907775.1 type IV secretion system protein VirB10 [Aminobacter ciceronei]MBA9021547.1 type IV secretion system protein VirB10 [Aminobacter ciceronei]MRX33959.1 conjugal transfer protein TraI [Aminobacter sp. MDW-2]QNH34011.1 TrbI/VirB10 family protein [Aminobacter sp. MDW-2]WAX94947.1 TrbI/VirB10 family protein [Aminobacter sp. NyZ550]
MSETDNVAPMRLRAETPRITRLSPKVIVGVGVVALLGIGGALIYALQTRVPGADDQELYSTANRQPADGLAGLPRDYAGPILGPALPGDLGRPILDAQNRGQPVVPPTIMAPPVDEAEQRRRAEEEAARTSTVFFQSRGGSAGTVGRGEQEAAFPGLDLSGQLGQQTMQDKQLAFLNAAADRNTVARDRVMPPASPFVLQAGAVIPAALITGIRSDLPGQVTAQVTENVYDSPTGRALLVPQGTRIIGQYDSNVQFGQRRALLVWNRLIFPSGRSIVLERLPGADTQGYAGLEDGVDYHWWDLAKAAGLSTLLAAGAELAINDEHRLLRAIRDGAQDTINDAGQQIIRRQLTVAPTLTIRPGFPVRVIVTRDLVLEPYGATQ